jgi:hypothetical protein
MFGCVLGMAVHWTACSRFPAGRLHVCSIAVKVSAEMVRSMFNPGGLATPLCPLPKQLIASLSISQHSLATNAQATNRFPYQ